MRCLTCKQFLSHTTIRSAHGVDGTYSVTFLNLPCLACPNGHERYYPIRHFEELLAEYFAENNHIAVNCRGDEDLEECPDCGRFVDESTVTPKEFRFEVELKDLEPFQVELKAPALNCSCGITFSSQRDEQSQSSLGTAVRKAFDSLNLGPPSLEWRWYKRIAGWLR